jgi:hypothetical protein
MHAFSMACTGSAEKGRGFQKLNHNMRSMTASRLRRPAQAAHPEVVEPAHPKP